MQQTPKPVNDNLTLLDQKRALEDEIWFLAVAENFAKRNDFALELGERQKHVQRQPAHAGRGVELLGDRDEGDAAAVKDLDELGKIGERARQPVDLVDNDDN